MEDNPDANGTVSVLLEKVAFVNKLGMLASATCDNETPTPGYLFREVSNITFESGSHCQTLLDYLVDRLDSRSYHIKLKVLRLMKFTLENGHIDFTQGLRKRSLGIKESMSFNGPPDPLHGNAPYLLIRQTAKEVCQMLFDTENEDVAMERQPIPVMGRTGIVGGMGRSSNPGRMEGFGNVPYRQDKTIGQSIISGLRDLTDKVVEGQKPLQSAAVIALENHFGGDYKAVGSEDLTDTDSAPVVNTATDKTVRGPVTTGHRQGRAGGGWEDPVGPPTNYPNTQSSGRSGGSSDLSERLDSVSVQDWSNEQQLVGDLIKDTQRSIPSRADVTLFLKRCSSQNCDKIVEILNDSLTCMDDKQLMRALVLLENLMRTDLVNFDHVTLVCQQNLVRLYRKEAGPVQSKTRKIVRQLEKLSKHGHAFTYLPSPLNLMDLNTPKTPSGGQSSNKIILINQSYPTTSSPKHTETANQKSAFSFIGDSSDQSKSQDSCSRQSGQSSSSHSHDSNQSQSRVLVSHGESSQSLARPGSAGGGGKKGSGSSSLSGGSVFEFISPPLSSGSDLETASHDSGSSAFSFINS